MTLCGSCDINQICHEIMKGHEDEHCLYFKGKIPEGFGELEYGMGGVWRIHRQNWRGHTFYIIAPDKTRVWLNDWHLKGGK